MPAPQKLPNLDVVEVPDGLVVFEPTRNRVHHLNATASLVFELCTGEHDVPSIIGAVQHLLKLPQPPVDEVQTAVASLRAEMLIA